MSNTLNIVYNLRGKNDTKWHHVAHHGWLTPPKYGSHGIVGCFFTNENYYLGFTIYYLRFLQLPIGSYVNII